MSNLLKKICIHFIKHINLILQILMQSYYGKAITNPKENVATWYDPDPERDPTGICRNGPSSAKSLRTIIYSHKAKPKEGRQKPQETKQGLLRELPKNAPLKGRFGSLWKTEGDRLYLACSGECKVFRP